jgi:hypothetical protein
MSERSRVFAATVAGAALGGLVGYLYFTANGRRMREQIEPRLDEIARELVRLRTTVQKARTVASEGWRSIDELAGHREQEWNQHARQPRPF